MDKMEKETYLSKDETEQLCSLYMECRLSRLEEAELEYVLEYLPYSSPIIDEVRSLMRVSLSCSIGEKVHQTKNCSQNRKKMTLRILITAASFLLLLSVGIPIFLHFKNQSEIYCQVFTNGKELSRDKALTVAEEELERIDRFFEIMSDIESEQQLKTDSFQ